MTEPPTLDSKDAILDAAQMLIAQHGFAGFSIRDLSRESGLAKGTIYHHFQDKREIYQSVMERDLAQFEGVLQEAVAGAEDPAAWLDAFVHAYLRQAAEQRSHIRVLLRELGAMEDEMRHMAQRVRERVAAPVAAVIERGSAEGYFRPVQPRIAVLSLIGALNTYIAWQLVVDEQEIDESVADAILDFFMQGIRRRTSND